MSAMSLRCSTRFACSDDNLDDNLGVKACDVSNCRALLTSVRDALWLMAGREGSFKWGQVSLPTCQVVAACT